MEPLKEAVLNEMKKVNEQRDALMHHPQIHPFIASVEKWVQQTQQRPITIYEKRNVAQCLYNCLIESGVKHNAKLFEATTESDIQFLGIQLPVITALLPSLVLNEVAIVQAIDRRIAAVFYLDVKYDSGKGEVKSGDIMIGAKTGHATPLSARRYAIDNVVREPITLASDDVTAGGVVAYSPGLIDFEKVKVEKLLGTTYTTLGVGDSAGKITGDGIEGTTGYIDSDGNFNFTLREAPGAGTILISYRYQYDRPTDESGYHRTGVPKAKVTVTQSPVQAMDFPLRAEWSLGAAIDLQKAHGIDLESELVKFLGGEVRFTIDQYGLEEIDAAAEDTVNSAGKMADWDARPSEGEAWIWKRNEFIDRIKAADNAIFKKTKRARATFIVCGNDVARVVTQLGRDYFTPVAGYGKMIATGPVKVGTLLNQLTVIQNPFKTETRYTVGFRGSDYLHAGFLYCPYIPLFATPTLTTADLVSQKGFLSAAAFKTVNAGMFCYGDIAHLQAGYVKGTEV